MTIKIIILIKYRRDIIASIIHSLQCFSRVDWNHIENAFAKLLRFNWRNKQNVFSRFLLSRTLIDYHLSHVEFMAMSNPQDYRRFTSQ